MKNQYKKSIVSVLYLIIITLMSACFSSLSYNDALQRNISRIEDPEKQDDARFMVEAASYNILATQLAQEAINSGYSASVVQMARQILEEHEDMAKELKKLARKEDIKLPAEMNSEHQQLLAELQSSDRREFDRTYIRILGDIARDDSQKFERIATEGNSEEIRAFAARKLDHFKSHLNQLETVDAELLRTY